MARPKGSRNKTTLAAKEAMRLAFDGIGGVPKLIGWAKANPTEFYKLWGRLIPMEHTGKDGGPVQHEHRIMKWGDLEIRL